MRDRSNFYPFLFGYINYFSYLCSTKIKIIETMEHLMNKCPIEIKRLAKTMNEEDVRQMIRFYFSRHLMNTSAENKMKVEIIFETDETFGLSTNDMLRIVSIWQDPCEGYITFDFEGGNWIDFDDLSISELFRIMTDFDDFYVE